MCTAGFEVDIAAVWGFASAMFEFVKWAAGEEDCHNEWRDALALWAPTRLGNDSTDLLDWRVEYDVDGLGLCL